MAGKGKKNEAVATSTNGANNGGLVFETMPDDFQLPTRQVGGEWDDNLKQVIDASPKLIRVFKSEDEKEVYSRAKSLRKAAKRAFGDKVDDKITIAVRKHPVDGLSSLFAQATE